MRDHVIETKVREHFKLYPYSKFSLSQINFLVFNNDCAVEPLLEVLLYLTKPPAYDFQKNIKLQVKENIILRYKISTKTVDLNKPYLNKRLTCPIRKIGMLLKPYYIFYRNF